MSNVIFIILGMAAVTYGPRLIPFLLLPGKETPGQVDAFLKCIPAAAIGALIIPGAFTATPDMPMAAIAGMGAALIFGLWPGGIVLPVLGSVAAAYLVLAFAA